MGRLLPAACLAFVLVGCADDGTGRSASASGLEDSTYVAVMARLAVVDSVLAPAGEPVRLELPRDSARTIILRAYGVRPEQLVRFAAAAGAEPERMRELLRHIRELADTLQARSWTPDAEERDPEAGGVSR